MISAGYLAQQRDMHARKVYGDSGKKWARTVMALCRETHATSLLDYGCGTGAMIRNIRKLSEAPEEQLREYDPGVPGKDERPEPADLVTCIDTLEHIEPEYLGTVLQHLRLLSEKACFMVISTRRAGKTLPDGRNAHLIVKQPPFWIDQIKAAGFAIDRRWAERPDELIVLAR